MSRVILISVVCLAGCTKPQTKTASLSPEAEAASEHLRATTASLKRLMSTAASTIEVSQAEVADAAQTHRIRTLEDFAFDGRRYSLMIDRGEEQVWILVGGGIGDHFHEKQGPWPMTDPDVQQLLELMGAESDSEVRQAQTPFSSE